MGSFSNMLNNNYNALVSHNKFIYANTLLIVKFKIEREIDIYLLMKTTLRE